VTGNTVPLTPGPDHAQQVGPTNIFHLMSRTPIREHQVSTGIRKSKFDIPNVLSFDKGNHQNVIPSQISLLSAVRIAHTASLAITSSRSPIYIVYSISRGECNCKCNMADIPSCRSIYTRSVTHIYHIRRANKPTLGNVYGDFQCGFVTSGCGAPSRRQYRTQLGIGGLV